MMEYFSTGIGYAIPVKNTVEFEPISLEELRNRFPGFVVPQSYYLLEKKEKLLKFFLDEEILIKRYIKIFLFSFG